MNKDYAIYYASIGWHVFPIYEMEGGSCSCGRIDCESKGKHPRLKDGLHAATTEAQLISSWWDIYPNANIGIRTGEISGFLVVDIDGDGELPERMPDTVCQTTGSGGQHLLYKYPSDGFIYKSGTHIYPSVDSRSEGGYIVATPSNHKSGGIYSWDIAPNEMELSECPKFWLDKIRKEIRSQEFESGEAVTETDERIDDMLKVIDPDLSYSEWVNIGMAIHSGTNGDGFTSWNNWSMRGSKYGGYEYTRNKWDSFSGNGISISTLSFMARENGWIDPRVEHGKMIAAAILKSEQMKLAERIAVIDNKIEIKKPTNIFPKRGLLKEITDFIVDTAQYEQPELALGAAIALVAAVGGRKYTTYTGATTCFYIMGVADTSGGKGHALGVMNKILFKVGIQDIVSGEPASGSAMYSALAENPNRIYVLDEIGDFFGRIMSPKSSSHEREIKAELLKFFSEAGNGGIVKGKDRANRQLNKSLAIHSPNVVIYGATTGQTFYEALNGGHIRDGLLSRILLIDSGSNRALAKKRINKEIPSYIIEKLSLISKFGQTGNLAGAVPTDVNIPNFHYVTINDDIDDNILEFTRYIDSIRGNTDTHSELYGRTSEIAVRLALVYAISVDHINPIIDQEAWEWAREFSLWCTNTMINQAKDNVSEGEYDAKRKKLLSIIKKSGKNGITMTKLNSESKIPSRERRDILQDLSDMNVISLSHETTDGRTKSVFLYVGD